MALEFRDKLGGVVLDPALIARTNAYVPPVVEEPVAPPVVEETGPWSCIHSQLSETDKKTIHRVEQRGKELRCTCQDFRLKKNANCKHIQAAKDQGKVV